MPLLLTFYFFVQTAKKGNDSLGFPWIWNSDSLHDCDHIGKFILTENKLKLLKTTEDETCHYGSRINQKMHI